MLRIVLSNSVSKQNNSLPSTLIPHGLFFNSASLPVPPLLNTPPPSSHSYPRVTSNQSKPTRIEVRRSKPGRRDSVSARSHLVFSMDFQSCATFYQDSSETWGAVGEAFHIDDLLDFSNDDIGAPIQNDEENSSDYTEVSAGSVERNYSSSVTQVTEELPAAELCVPMDTLADLEWLSTFVEDSFMPELPPGCGPASELVPSTDGNKTDSGDNKETKPQSYKISYISPCNWIPVKARSKRSRTGCRVWSFNNPLLPANPGFESDGVVFTQSSDSSCSDSSQPRPAKKYKKSHSKKAQDGSQPRRCSHCLVQKTPQWRAGPLGPKTLCNACGVRFKSGRLVPEYRPAISPTFLTEVHSNSHRKILEMRRQKEEEEQRSDITSQTCSNGGNESFFGNSLPSQEPIRV